MTIAYDKYYRTDNLFGDPYPELIEFFAAYPVKGKVLDLGCGQGRNAIALARLGYSVTGIDQSRVGIDQMNMVGKKESLDIVGMVQDIHAIQDYEDFDIILLDSMFHFTVKDKRKEIDLIKKVMSSIRKGGIMVICIQDSGNKVDVLNKVLALDKRLKISLNRGFKYVFQDKASGHRSETDYRMVVVEKC